MGAEEAQKAANDFLAKAVEMGGLEAAAAETEGVNVQTAENFTRVNVPNVNLSGIEDFGYRTLSAPVGAIAVDVARSDAATGVPTTLVVWRLKEKNEPTQEAFRENYPRLLAQYLRLKGEGLSEEQMVDWYNQGKIRVRFGEAIR
jgi:hypothetical protein